MLQEVSDQNIFSCDAALGTDPDCSWGSYFPYFSQKRLDGFHSNFHITFFMVATTYCRKEFWIELI